MPFATVTKSASAKLARASKNIDRLAKDIDDYLSSKPFRFVGEGRYGLNNSYVAIIRVMPVETNIFIGEIIHNLRSALENLMYSWLKFENTTLADDKISFPFSRKDKKRFEEMIDGLSIKDHSIFSYLRSLELYPGGRGHLLMLVHNLWNLDKHREIVVSSAAIKLTGLQKVRTQLGDGKKIIESINDIDLSADATDDAPHIFTGHGYPAAYAKAPVLESTQAPDAWKLYSHGDIGGGIVKLADTAQLLPTVPAQDALRLMATTVGQVIATFANAERNHHPRP